MFKREYLLKNEGPMLKFLFRNNHLERYILLGVFLIGTAFFYWNQRHWTQLYFSDYAIAKNDIVFGADTKDTIRVLRSVNFGGDMRKHVLFSWTLAPFVEGLQNLLGINYSRAIRSTFALVAGLNVAGAFALLRKRNSSLSISLLFTLLYGLSFSVFVIYSIPETYQMSNLLIVLYLIYLFYSMDNLTWKNCLFLSVLAGVASLYNYPLLSLLGIHLLLVFRNYTFGRWFLIALLNVGVGLAVFGFVNYIIYGAGFTTFFFSYSGQWASAANFQNLTRYADVAFNFLLFAIVSPIDHMPADLSWQDMYGYLATNLGIVLILIWICGLLYMLFRILISYKKETFNFALFAWVVVMILFYVYFNPNEALLYSSQTTLPILMMVSSTLDTPSRFHWLKFAAFLFFCVLLAINNGMAFY